jgi:hypothetical protein
VRFAIVVLVATSAGISGGLLAGAVADAEPSKTHVRYDAWITSSAGAPNTNVTLTCGWHADNCYGTPGGDALDWTASNTAVYLRGGFKRQYTSGVSGSYLYGWRFGAIFNDPANCEEAVVDVNSREHQHGYVPASPAGAERPRTHPEHLQRRLDALLQLAGRLTGRTLALAPLTRSRLL